jgi:hypothetical protein
MTQDLVSDVVGGAGRPRVWASTCLLALLSLGACEGAKVRASGSMGGSGAGGAGSGGGFTVPTGPAHGDGGLAPPCGASIDDPSVGVPCPDAAVPPTPPPTPPKPPAVDAAPTAPPPAPPSPPPPSDCPPDGPVTAKVRAWGANHTCVYLKAGESADITATGRWRARAGNETGPEGGTGNEGGCPLGALVARVAKFHQRTCIRAKGRITAQRDGYLWLYQSGGWNAMQSTGEITATITGGGRSTLWPEGMTPVGDDTRIAPERLAAFEAVCGPGIIPVHFEAQEPNHPRVQAYVQQYYGGDPVGVISKNIVKGCAMMYETPADFPKAHRDRRVRVVHYIGTTNRWPDLNRPKLRNARGEHWDFELTKTLAEITSMQPDYSPFGGPPVSIMHEVGHLIAPDGGGGKLPKWLGETYAELTPSHLGGPMGFHNAIDNPESIRWGAHWWWCDGNFGGPTFVEYIDEHFPGFIHKLTKESLRIGRNGTWPGSETLFPMLTGRPFDQLWAGYVDHYNFRPPGRPVEECMDPRE